MNSSDEEVRARIASCEVGKCWASDEEKILDYFEASIGKRFSKSQALDFSWCTFFVMWVLKQAGAPVMPEVGATYNNNRSVARFLRSQGGAYPSWDTHDVSFAPEPGDLYHLTTKAENYHVGVITNVLPSGEVCTADGNGYSASLGDLNEYVKNKDGKKVKKIGSGYVSRGGPGKLSVKHPKSIYIRVTAA